MLFEIQKALRNLLSNQGHINASDVELRFDPPTREWTRTLTRPTIDFFLFDLQENTDLRHNNFTTTTGNNRAAKRLAPRRMDLRYMVSVFTTVIEDEHTLLWRTLVTLMKYSPLPPEVLPEPLRTLEPPLVTRVSQPGEHSPFMELWRGLEVPPRPALLYVVTTPLDLDIAIESPLVLTRTTRYARLQTDTPTEGSHLIGGVVRNKTGTPLAGVAVGIIGGSAETATTNPEGKFVLHRLPSGSVTLQVVPTAGPPQVVTIEVPAGAYDITLE